MLQDIITQFVEQSKGEALCKRVSLEPALGGKITRFAFRLTRADGGEARTFEVESGPDEAASQTVARVLEKAAAWLKNHG